MIDFTRSGQTNDQTEQANGLSLSPLQSLVQQIVETGRLITPLAVDGGLVKIGKLQLDPLPHQHLRRAGLGKTLLQLGNEPAEHLPAGVLVQHVAGERRLYSDALAHPPGLHRLIVMNPSAPEVARQWILATNQWAKQAYEAGTEQSDGDDDLDDIEAILRRRGIS